MKRALSIKNLNKMQKCATNFEGEWKKLLGTPVLNGSWLVWGQSSNGKTRFVIKLAKYLTNFGKVVYNSCEEGAGETLRIAFEQEKMIEVNGKLVILDNANYAELIDYLSRPKSPKIVIIDSLQYLGINFSKYQKLIERFPTKLFIWTSHADGKNPAGRVATQVRYQVAVKIWVEGFKAYAQSRYGSDKEPFIIWHEGADMYNAK